VCDAAFFRNKVTYVIGGGDAAMEDTLALTKFAKEVTVIHRRDSFKASKIMQERVLGNEKVKVIWNSGVKEIKGDQKVTSLVIENHNTHATQELPADGVFIAIGHKPTTGLFQGALL
jgi:thioredoxin reductase (NADPH)